MSLRERILIVLLVMLCCYAGLEFFVLKKVVAPELSRQEQQQAIENVYRCKNAIQTSLSELHGNLSSWSKSGQLYVELTHPSPDLNDAFVSSLNMDFLAVYNNTWNRIGEKTDGTDLDIDTFLFAAENPLINKNFPGSSRKALACHQGRLWLVISAPVTKSTLSRTVEGTVVAGCILNTKRLEALRNQLQLSFEWDILKPQQLIGQNKEIVSRISDTDPFDLIPLGKEILQASAVLYDYQKQPVLLIKYFQDRSITRQSLHVMMMTLYGKVVAGVVALLLLTWLLQCVVVNPIIKLIKYVVNVEHPSKSKDILALSRKDEIGTLANEFNEMCLRLQNAQVKLMEKSYLSGVTEMSSGILHNVRNALSPITTRIERIKDQFKSIPLQNLEQAQTELQHKALDHERRKDLMRFVDLTFQDVLTNLNEMVSGLDDLADQVFQIEDMLNLQRTFGKEDKPVQFIEPSKLLNNALDIIPESFRNGCRISIDSGIKKLPVIPVEPTTFVQILQNLLINAAESLERENPIYRKIHIHTKIETIDDKPMLHWTIQDNGAGVPAEKTQQIFERGASSKRNGLTGIGLHWCANTITAMKGRIWAESKGLHQGAAFHILIPVTAEEELVETAKGQANESE
ncbi:MAG: ATP-binding protein [Planctomycetota bacterium]|jgi:signal transduction histidine kinase